LHIGVEGVLDGDLAPGLQGETEAERKKGQQEQIVLIYGFLLIGMKYEESQIYRFRKYRYMKSDYF
jgi:hypothetical protein